MPVPAIAVDALEKSFPPARSGMRAFLQPFERASVAALSGLSFRVEEGESISLLGTNGAGKSTLLRILATLLLPSSGSATVAGHDVAREARVVRAQLGYHAGSDLGFYARLTGRQNLRFFGSLNHLTSNEAAKRIAALSDQFEIGDAMDRQVRTLSSGTIQRLSLVRALLHRPRVLLLDEPTRSLDALAAAAFRHFLKREVLQAGKTTVLFASHTLPEIELLADRIAVLSNGRLVALETLSGLKTRANARSLEEAFFKLTGHAIESTQRVPT